MLWSGLEVESAGDLRVLKEPRQSREDVNLLADDGRKRDVLRVARQEGAYSRIVDIGASIEPVPQCKCDVASEPRHLGVIEVEHLHGQISPDEIVELEVAVDDPVATAVVWHCGEGSLELGELIFDCTSVARNPTRRRLELVVQGAALKSVGGRIVPQRGV